MSVSEAALPLERIVAAHTRFRREIALDERSQPLVERGRDVAPGDVVIERVLPAALAVIDLARDLGLPPDRAREKLTVQPDDPVKEGQTLAERGGFSRRSVKSPVAGRVLFVDDYGRLLIRGAPRREQRRAIVKGRVAAIDGATRLVITGQGARIQGFWGNNRENFGLIQLLARDRESMISGPQIGAGLQGVIVIAGATVDAAALEAAGTYGVRGMIVGSLDGTLLPIARRAPFPILVTEGFGRYPINEPSFALLSLLDGREGSLLCAAGARPELVAPRNEPAPEIETGRPLAPDDRVRILTAPDLGRIGVVTRLFGRGQTLIEGQPVASCEVRVGDGERLVVPYTNLERLLE